MRKITSPCLWILFSLLFINSSVFAAQDFDLHCYSKAGLKKLKLNLVLYPLLTSSNAYQVWFGEWLQAMLIKNGHSVIERTNFVRILQELGLDQSGATKEGDAESKIGGLASKSDIKKIGELLGVDAILFFAVWDKQVASFRVVDCQTSEIIISGMVRNYDSKDFAFETATVIVCAIELSLSGNNIVHAKLPFGELGQCREKGKTILKKKVNNIEFEFYLPEEK